jgi:hypothetical protein
VREERDLLAPIAERRQRDGEDAEPVEEVLAEGAGADQLLEVAVGGGDEPDIDRDGLVGADGPDLPCSCGEMVLISSRKRVPPRADSARPLRSLTAPVNAPRT